MKGTFTCPRCGDEVHPPDAWSSRWTCGSHGVVYPLSPIRTPSARRVRQLGQRSPIPMWMPWPLPRGWVVSAVLDAGDDASGLRAVGIAVGGPNPLGGPADLVLVAEEQGVGLGAGLAGLAAVDPGRAVEGDPRARVEVQGRSVPLWFVQAAPDRAAYVGPWGGTWLWAVLYPAAAAVVLLEDVCVADLRDLGSEVELLPFGTPPPWLLGRGFTVE